MHSSGARYPRINAHVPILDFRKYEAVLRENHLGVELYIASHAVDALTEKDLRAVSDAMDWGPTLSIHGPFMDLCPGAVDSRIAAASLERYIEVMSISEILRPEVVVFHSGYEKWKYAGETRLWLDQSIKTWRAVMDRAGTLGVKVAIENIVDAEPDHLRLLADEMDDPLFGLCLDVGHREIFSEMPIAAWVDGMHPHIFELHLHDNHGAADEHLPVGCGRVDFAALFSKLTELSIDPVYTVEAHSPEDALTSLENLSTFFGKKVEPKNF